MILVHYLVIQAPIHCSAAPQRHRGVEAAGGDLPEAEGEGWDRDRGEEDEST